MNQSRPNFLFFMPDQLRRCAVGYEGGPVPTPHFDRLAEAGTSFAQAYCAYPMCGPSRAALLTGRPCHALRDDAGQPYLFNDRLLDPTETTYPRILTAAGYHCAYIGKWHNDSQGRFIPRGPRRLGFDDVFMGLQPGGSLTHPFHFDDDGNKVGGDREMWEPDYQTDRAIEYLRHAASRPDPFCLTISCGPPHAPYDVLTPDRRYLFEEASRHVKDVRPNVPDPLRADALRISTQYHALVMGLDDCMGRLLQALDELNLTDQTVVVFTSDHGDNLLSHGCRAKNQFWEEAAGVPLVIRWPGVIPAGGRVSGPTSQVDLAPTLIDFAEIEPSSRMLGQSLAPRLDEDAAASDRPAFLEINHPWWDWFHGQGWQGHRRCVVTDRWKLVVREAAGGAAEPEALYDLLEDPFEAVNLVREPASIQRIAELGRLLLRWMAETNDPFLDIMLFGMDESTRRRHRRT